MAEVSVPLESMGLSNEELFGGSVSDKAPEAAPQEAAPEPSQIRDEQGRFAKVEAQPEQPKVAEAPQAVTPAVDQTVKPQETEAIPPWRLRELREARDTVQKQFEDERAARVRLEAQLQQFMSQQQQQNNPPPDIFQDPNAWQAHLNQEVRRQNEVTRFDLSEDWARDKFGDQKVDEALKWTQQNLDPSTQSRIQNARNPYREMVKLFDERQTLSQIGGDLKAYNAKYEEQLLADPAFMQKVAEKLRGQAPATNQRPAVQIPPSLNKATGSSNSAELTTADMSNEGLFGYATAR